MKKSFYLAACVVLAALMSGCSAIGGIFKAGAVTGVIAVVIIIAIILWIMSAFRRRS